jgi:predicted transcriptional regulator
MTGKAIHDLLPRELSYSALRSMLMRLCRKRILHRRKVTGSHDPRDRRIPYLYVPAITEELVRRRALTQLTQDYFDGSLNLVLCEVAEVLKSQSQAGQAGTLDVAA